MKAAAFDYVKPRSIDQVISLLQEHGDDARLLAGGQTLLATLNMRLSEPGLLVDISGLDALRGIGVQGGMLRIGALTTHTEIEGSALVAQHAPLLAQAAPHIAHRAIRNAGTFGGSIAYADPAAEWPACLLALGGTVVARGPKGERRIAADDFFQGLYTTALEPDEVLVACELPLAAPGSGSPSTNSRAATATTPSSAWPSPAGAVPACWPTPGSCSWAWTRRRCARARPRPC